MKRETRTEMPVNSGGVLKSSMVHSVTGQASTPSRRSRAAGVGGHCNGCRV
jgi:hypothetical protein